MKAGTDTGTLESILVPLDGSGCAQHAFDYALAMAKSEGARIEIIAVVDPRAVLGYDLPDALDESHVAAAMAEAERVVSKAVSKAVRSGTQATGHTTLGDPSDEIVGRAMSLRAGTIVMGTHGRSGFKQLFIGSVAQHVLRFAPCPVVVIREKTAFKREVSPAPSVDGREPIFALRLVQVDPDDFEMLYRDIASFMDGPGHEIDGILESQVLGSTDKTRIVVLAKFRSHGDWARAQWDTRLGKLLEEITLNSQTLEFDLYRGRRFLSDETVLTKPVMRTAV